MDSSTKKVFLVALGGVSIILLYIFYSSRRKKYDGMMLEFFNPKIQQPLYFEGMPPSLKIENAYHSLMMSPKSDGGCDGDYSNVECRQKSYIKAMKGSTTDKADLICQRYSHDEDKYYACLDSVYGNYLWMDRNTGVESCKCFGDSYQYSGSKMQDGSCFCPSKRALIDRNMVDQNDLVV